MCGPCLGSGLDQGCHKVGSLHLTGNTPGARCRCADGRPCTGAALFQSCVASSRARLVLLDASVRTGSWGWLSLGAFVRLCVWSCVGVRLWVVLVPTAVCCLDAGA